MMTQRSLLIVTLLLLSACVKSGDIKEPTGSPEEAGRAYFKLGAEYLKQNNLPVAYEKLKTSIGHDPNVAQVHAFFAFTAEQLDLRDEAKKHYLEALRLSPKDPAVQNMYGTYLYKYGDASQAEEYFLQAAKNRFYSTPEAAYVNAGKAALKLNNKSKAEEHFRYALQLNPKYALALWHMASLNYNLSRDLQARAFLERIGTAEVLPPEALLLGYQIAKRSGRNEDVVKYSKLLKSKYPESTQTTKLLESQGNGG